MRIRKALATIIRRVLSTKRIRRFLAIMRIRRGLGSY
jgi:hypothetical protein